MKKAVAVMMTFLLLCLLFAGCNRGDGAGEPSPRPSSSPPVTAEPSASPEVSPPPSPSPAMSEEEYADIEHFYTIPLGDIWWTVDQNGNTVSEAGRGEWDSFDVLTDLFTGTERYHIRNIAGAWGKGGVEAQPEYALFDLAGEQLTEWGTEYYRACFDGFVMRDRAPSENGVGGAVIIDVATGETVYDFDGSGHLWRFGERVIFAPLVMGGGTLIFFDRQMNVADEYRVPRGYDLRIYGDCLYVTSGHEVLLAMDSAGNALPEPPFLTYLARGGIGYADKNVYLLINWYDRESGKYTNTVCDSDTGETIGEPFSYLEANSRFTGGDGAAFFGVRDGRALLLDGNGAVLVESEEIDGLQLVEHDKLRVIDQLGPGVYSVDLGFDGTGASAVPTAGLLDENLDAISTDERYEAFYNLNDTDTDFFVGARRDPRFRGRELYFFNMLGRSGYFSDILTPSGEAAVKNLRAIFAIGPGRFAVRRGYDVGLMDWNGNWIVKRSVFGELED